MEEHTIAVVASNLTAAYFSGGTPAPETEGPSGTTPTGASGDGRFAAVIEKFHEFSAALREHARREYEEAQREEARAEEEDADKPVHVY
ncbi:MAG TPA: hypothetical protein VF576_05150 [Rubricoccaceae bacterium]|jgi:hypothetical protein